MADYLDNPHWRKFYYYSMGPPNGGTYRRWIQGSVGMMEPMPLWSNEYGHVYMKHGQNNVLPYRGNIKDFSRSVTPDLKMQVDRCTYDTTNPAGCQTAAIQKVYTHDSTPNMSNRMGTGDYRPGLTPHPMKVSYMTGFSPLQSYIPPNSKYQG